MWKKAIAVFLVLIICTSIAWAANPVTPTVVSADSYKSGFSVVPEKEDETGVALDSGFILSSENPVTLEEVKEIVSLRDAEPLTITEMNGGKYLLKPSRPLEQNKVYFIDINTGDDSTVSFTFQTKRDFTVLGSLPENYSTYVPLDTGIELYFSYPDIKNLSDYFEITPLVKGRFESYGHTTVFIPEKRLNPQTVYTVKIKKGLSAADGAAILEEDYVFSFETSPDEKSTADPFPGYLSISNSWFEYGTREKPVIPFDLYLNNNPSSVDVTLKAYKFNSLDDFISAIRSKDEVPSWAPFAMVNGMIDTGGLSMVLEFKQNFNLQKWQQRYMMFPETLPHGFYLIELTTEKLKAQAFLQVSDIASYSLRDSSNTLFWLNSLVTGKPVKGAEVRDLDINEASLSDIQGLVKLSNGEKEEYPEKSTRKLYKVTTRDGNISLINAGFPYITYEWQGNDGLYWRYLQTDRTLYKPNDEVGFWGFVKSRIDNTSPRKVTVELASGGYYYPLRSKISSRYISFISNPLKTITIDTEEGFFEGNFTLPALDPGSYTITVKDGEKILSSTYFRVDNYIKPQYKLEISSDKKAVFTGETITFSIKASFFDGTPVSNIPLSYNIGYNAGKYYKNLNGTGMTDKSGTIKVEYTPEYEPGMQGEFYGYFHANAQFPETGNISESYYFRGFANDMHIDAQGEIRNNKCIVNVTTSAVSLELLNDEDDTNDSFLGKPISGKSLELNLIHITWEKIETGNEYDPINKVVRKIYEYREKRTNAGKSTVITGGDGTARFEMPVNNTDDGYYTAEITSKDQKGRTMNSSVWIYKNRGIESAMPGYEYYSLVADKERYKANEMVNLKVLKNNEEPLRDMSTLFVESRNGIQSYTVKSQPAISLPFPEKYAPNFYMDSIVFNGKAFIETSCVVVYDYDEKELNLDIKTDKDSYKPGENMTIELKATDKSGNPVKSMVNLSLVDEALLKLSGQYINPLTELYSWIGKGVIHNNSSRDYRDMGRLAGGSDDSIVADKAAEAAQVPAPAPSSAPDVVRSENGSVTVRSDFKDTALFKTIQLDSNGYGTITFKLPDNITSFSLAAAAVSQDLFAGSKIQSAKVSMPFFINDALSTDYLVGDKPYIGITAYGEELDEDEDVTFEITLKEMPSFKETVTSKAFTRVNLPLPSLSEGSWTLIIKAISETGKTDALSRTITFHTSYRTIEASVMKALVPNTAIEAGNSGITTLIFSDAGRGQLINSLHGLAWQYGNRLDQKLVTNYARKLLNELIKDGSYWLEPEDVTPSDYKNEDGGYGILPYAGTDLKFTALITPLLMDVADTSALKIYFYDALLSSDKIQAPALYALAKLGEPVLLDLNRAKAVENLKLEDYLYLGLAYEALGDQSAAREIYEKRISPDLERKDPFIRVKIINNDIDKSYRLTALTALLASKIDNADASKLYEYVENNYSKTEYTGVEKILYLEDRMNKLSNESAAFTYRFDGKTNTVNLENGVCEVIKVPSMNIKDFRVTKVIGNVTVISLFAKPYTEGLKDESAVTMTRKYYNATTGKETTSFAPDDIVKVEITYKVNDTAIDNTYEISDYVPSGLKPLANPWNYGIKDYYGYWYRQFDRQKVTFVVGKSKETPKPLVYYARVVSPGEYTAQGTVAQGSLAKSSIVTLDNTKITISH